MGGGGPEPEGVRVGIVVVSDRVSRGAMEDESGAVARAALAEAGFAVATALIVPDEVYRIRAALVQLVDEEKLPLVLTLGGTGLSPRDVTPEATRQVLEREAPGLAEMLRWEGYRQTPYAALSRGTAGVRGRSLIVNLPGSPRAVQDGIRVLAGIVSHALAVLREGEGPLAHGAPGPDNPTQEKEDT